MQITSNNKIKQVFGGLLGIKSQNKTEIFYSFEFLNLNPETYPPKFDMEFIDSRKKLTDQLFQNQNYELIGFYKTEEKNSMENPLEIKLIEIMNFYSVINPYCLILGTNLDNLDELPVECFESKNFGNNLNFSRIPHKIEGSDSERITLDSVMKFSEKSTKESANEQNLKIFKNALDVLRINLSSVLEAGRLEKNKNDPIFQRNLSEVISNFPSFNSFMMKEVLVEKEYEKTVMNNLCSCTVNELYMKKYKQ